MSQYVRLLLLITLALWLASPVNVARAQMTEQDAAVERDLTALVLPSVPSSRVSGPLPVTIEITSTRTDIVTGRLRLEMVTNVESPYAWVSDRVAVAPGKTRLQTLLPGIGQYFVDDVVPATLTLVTDDEEIDLSQHPVVLFSHAKRTFVLGVSEQFGRRSTSVLRETLRLEEYCPDVQDDDITTFTDRRDPLEMPRSVSAYLAYDLLVLIDDGFAFLDQAQLDAIADWVRAGGGLLVIPDRRIESRHVAFLNTLAGEPRYVASAVEEGDRSGVNIATGDSSQGTDLLFAGLGRAAVCYDLRPHDSRELLDSTQWREVVAHLWQISRDQRDTFIQTGKWDHKAVVTSADSNPLIRRSYTPRLARQRGSTPVEPDAVAANRLAGRQAEDVDYSHLTLYLGDWLTQQLMPKDAKFIPMWLIWTLLIALILFIGPADYILLSLFGARRWTWVTFPVAIAVFTIVLVQAARQSIGEATTVRGIELRDVGRDGQVIRKTSLQLWFAGGSVTERFELDNTLLTPIDRQSDYLTSGLPRSATDVRLTYEGSLAGAHVAAQRFSRWTPQLDRTSTIEADASASDDEGLSAEPSETHSINWSALDEFSGAAAGWLAGEHNMRTQLREDLLGDRMPEARVIVLHRRSAISVDENGRVTDLNQALQHIPAWGYGMLGRPTDDQLNVVPAIAHVMSARPDFGLFAVVPRLSPTGGDTFEDLALLDVSNPDECVVLVIVPDGDSYIIYRRLIRQGDA